MSDIENKLNDKKYCLPLIYTDFDGWIYCDKLVESCKQQNELFEYVCKQTFSTIRKHFKDAESIPKILSE